MTNRRPPLPPDRTTIMEAAELLGVCRTTVYRLIGRGQLSVKHTNEYWPSVLIRDVLALRDRRNRMSVLDGRIKAA